MGNRLTELLASVAERVPDALSDRDYIESAYRKFAGHPGAFRQCAAMAPEAALTRDELGALRRVGLAADDAIAPDADHARDEVLRAWFLVYRSALSTQATARMLGVDPSRIRQRLKDRTLIALDDSGEVRIPVLLFEDGHEIPGLRRVLPAVAPDVKPLEVLSWLATPTYELEDAGGAPRSPRDYLLATGNPDPVIQLAVALGSGEAA